MSRPARTLLVVICAGVAATAATVGVGTASTPAARQAPPVEAATATRIHPLPFAGGEVLTFSVAWLKIVGGNATLTVSPPEPFHGKPALRIVSLARSNEFFTKIFSVNDRIESWVRLEPFRTLRYEVHLREGTKTEDELIVFDPQRNLAFHGSDEIATSPNVQDTLSAFYLTRGLALVPGARYRIDVISGGKNYDVTVDVVGRETLRTAAGTWKTVKIEPKMSFEGIFRKRGRLFIWISDDARRLPVFMRSALPIGSITATLTAWSQGTATPQRAPGVR